MIRNARPEDAGAMADIYNFYIRESVATFDTDPLPTTTMSRHIASASEGYPCLICEEEGQVAGFCYAHPWKEKAAYRHTLELRFIFIRNIPEKDWEDIDGTPHRNMPYQWLSCPDCVYHRRK